MKIARLAGIRHRKLKFIFDTISPIGKMLDNLIKGGAGQAVQNMNLKFGFNEAEGLR